MGFFINKGARPQMGPKVSRWASPKKKIKAEHQHRSNENGRKYNEKLRNGKDWTR